MTERDFSQRTSFEAYSYTDPNTGEVFDSPFAVAVYGVRRELLGVGRMIGITRDVFDGNPVIQLDDPTSPSGSTELLGAECWWIPVTSITEGSAVDPLLAIPEEIMPVSTYILNYHL